MKLKKKVCAIAMAAVLGLTSVVSGVALANKPASADVVPTITKDLEDKEYKVGDKNAQLAIEATNSEIAAKHYKDKGLTLTYQWYKATAKSYNGTAITGATNATLNVTTTTAETAYYYCIVSETYVASSDAVSGEASVDWQLASGDDWVWMTSGEAKVNGEITTADAERNDEVKITAKAYSKIAKVVVSKVVTSEDPTEAPTTAAPKDDSTTAAPTEAPTTAAPTTAAPTTATPTTAEAQATSAAVGETLKNGKVTYKVTADGKVAYKSNGNKNAKSVKIPSSVTVDGVQYSVTSIANNAFKNCKKMTSVTIPASVTKIGDGAFQNCTKLKKVTIPKNVKTIGKNAFSGDKKLKTITIKGTKITKVGKNAFKSVPSSAKAKTPKAKKSAYKKLLKNAKFKGTVK